jgi:hypothetical protein
MQNFTFDDFDEQLSIHKGDNACWPVNNISRRFSFQIDDEKND